MKHDYNQLEQAFRRLGEFGNIFVDYKGCPRGARGRACVPLEEEVLLMPTLTDVDGGKWIPVNADALHELVDQFKKLRESSRWIPVTERLPEVGRSVIAYNASAKCAAEAVYKGEGKFLQFRWAARLQEQEVTHWMPLPEPPKEE